MSHKPKHQLPAPLPDGILFLGAGVTGAYRNYPEYKIMSASVHPHLCVGFAFCSPRELHGFNVGLGSQLAAGRMNAPGRRYWRTVIATGDPVADVKEAFSRLSFSHVPDDYAQDLLQLRLKYSPLPDKTEKTE